MIVNGSDLSEIQILDSDDLDHPQGDSVNFGVQNHRISMLAIKSIETARAGKSETARVVSWSL